MAKGTINKVILVGRLGLDPEIRYTPGGAAVARLSLATNESYKDKSGQWVEQTEWHRVSFMGKLAEVLGEFGKKGTLLYVEGRIKNSKWKDSTGQMRYMTEIVGQEMQFLGGRGEGSGASSAASYQEGAVQEKKGKASSGKPAQEYPEELMPSSEILSPVPDEMRENLITDDDIPF